MITGNEPAMSLDYDLVDTSRRGMALGLTIRQHFAAMAMQGILASCEPERGPFIAPDWLSQQSVLYADALIAELNKTEK